MAGENILAKLAVQISANNAQFTKQLSETRGQLGKFEKGLGTIAKSVVGAFAVKEVAQFAFEISKLAGEAEGVQGAFRRLPDNVVLMNNLKEATKGTVSELELMKRSVQAANFGISLQALPKLLEFATIRAQQTGQSVDYLVDSIVTGIGRKSPLILDNLGISAVALRDKLGGVSLAAADVGTVAEAVGQIASDELQKMGQFSDNAATKVQSLSASWEDFKVTLGSFLNETGVLPNALNKMTEALNFFRGETRLTNDVVKSAEKQLGALIKQARAAGDTRRETYLIQQLADLASKYGLVRDKAVEFTEAQQKEEEQIENIAFLTGQLNILKEEQQQLVGQDLANTNKEIKAIEAKIKALRELGIAQRESNIPSSVAFETPSIDEEEIRNAFFGFDKLVIPVELEIPEESTEAFDAQIDAIAERIQAQRLTIAEAFVGITNILENSIQAAIQGQQSFAQALGGITLDIVDMFLKQALAAAIANAIKSGGPLPVGLALAGVGIAAVKALFAKNVGRSSGGGGGSSGVQTTRVGVPQSSTTSQDIRISVDQTVIRGQDIWLSFKAVEQSNNFTRSTNG